MLETALVAFATFFATVDPPGVAVLFAALVADRDAAERRAIAARATLVAAAILLAFALFGGALLALFGISLAALRTAGGVLLLLIAIDLVFARSSGGTTATSEERAEARRRDDVTVFPLATPLIAGPGAIGATVVLVADGGAGGRAVVVAALLAVLALSLALMLVATRVQRLLGVTGVHVIARVMGILLAALAVQFLFDGIAASGLVPHAGDGGAAPSPLAAPAEGG